MLEIICTICCYWSKLYSKQKGCVIILILIIKKIEKILNQKSLIIKITPYYFDGTININDLDLKNISLDEKSHDSAKPLRIILNKVDGYARKSDKTNI